MTELEKAVEAYIDNPANYLEYQDGWEDLSDLEYVEKAFKAGANWQYEQFEKERLKHCDELTAEQAQMESDFVVQHLKNFNRTPTFIDAIEYGRRLMIDKATEWLCHNYDKYIRIIGRSVYPAYAELCKDFQKAMED